MSAGVASIIAAAVFIFFSAAVLLYWYAFRFEVTNFKIKNNIIYLRSETGKSSFPVSPLRILHLSDFHLRTDFKGKKLEQFIKTLSSGRYDFIFITGDMTEKNELQDELIEALKPLKAKYGIYAVFGAHDYYNKKPQEFIKNMFKKKESYSRGNDSQGLKKKLGSIGINVLQNESVILKDINGYDEIDIIGVDDPLINKMDLKKSLSGIFGDLNDIKILDVTGKKYSHEGSDVLSDSDKHSFSDENELKIQESNYMAETEGIINTKEYREELNSCDKKYHVISEGNKLKITLVHTPDSYALVNLAINGIDIVFAGHTHGGQVRAPGVGALISGCNLKTKYAAGLFYFKNFVLQVSKGLGEGRFSRFRINCSPEAIITEIVREQ